MERVALLFSGQGSQYVGMGKNFFTQFPKARAVYEEADDILKFGLSKLCFEGKMEDLTRTENAQPAILVTSIAMLKVYLQECGILPEQSAGHSLGEISALTAAGAIDFSDALKIVRQRGRLMQEAGTGSMAAVKGIDVSIIENECQKNSTPEQWVGVSNYNSPDQTVISGAPEGIAKIAEILTQYGANLISLKVSAAFHSPMMQKVAEKMTAELGKYQFKEFNWPVISNVTAMPYPSCNQLAQNLISQITSPVRWKESMNYLQRQGITIAIEIGPQVVLRNLMKRNVPQIAAYAYDQPTDFLTLQKILAPKKPEASQPPEFVHTVVTKCIQIAVCTKNRNWDNDAYQKGVIEPYRQILQMQDGLEKDGKEPTFQQMSAALQMLRSVFVTKLTPVEEQIQRFNEVFTMTGTRELFSDFKMPTISEAS